MSEFPARSCSRCGTRDGMMAQVSDPFADHCYGLCRSCLYAAKPVREEATPWVPGQSEWVPDERTVRAVIDALREEDDSREFVRGCFHPAADFIAERFGITDKERG